MTKRILAAVVVLFVALPAGASAHTTIIEPAGSHFPYQQWVDEAKVPTPNVTVEVVEHTDQPGDCDGRPSLACTDGETIWIAPWIPMPRDSFLHELGHIFALHHPEIAAFDDERFADIYSLCARLTEIAPRWAYSAGEGLIPGRRLRSFCAHIRDAQPDW